MTVDDVDSIETVEAEITQIHIAESDRLWTDYLAARKQEFISSSIDTIGSEYLDNRRFWNTQFEREWAIIAERLSSGFGLTDDILQLVGYDFFKTNDELQSEITAVKEELETEIIGSGACVRVYSWEDFSALHRQGIFQESEFILSLGSGWKKNMLRELRDVWGYQPVGEFPLNGERHLILQQISGGGGFND
tara:strand:+ start:289 stop:864 length:576 start_codon:yes stop_codon:yes gene_type:complete